LAMTMDVDNGCTDAPRCVLSAGWGGDDPRDVDIAKSTMRLPTKCTDAPWCVRTFRRGLF
jgi:hypothetical protein